MLAIVKQIIDSEKLLVEIEVETGSFRGYWQDFEPTIGKQYVIEIDIDTVIDNENATIEPTEVNECLVYSDSGHTFFQCLLDDSEPDGMLTLRVLGSIFLASYAGDLLAVSKFYLLRVNTENVLIYDTHTV
jgi:hypothetical protein